MMYPIGRLVNGGIGENQQYVVDFFVGLCRTIYREGDMVIGIDGEIVSPRESKRYQKESDRTEKSGRRRTEQP